VIDTSWRLGASCRDTPVGEFFDYEKQPNGEPSAEILALCGACPVADCCAEYAITYEEFGLWAGMTARERIVIRKATGIRLRRQHE